MATTAPATTAPATPAPVRAPADQKVQDYQGQLYVAVAALITVFVAMIVFIFRQSFMGLVTAVWDGFAPTQAVHDAIPLPNGIIDLSLQTGDAWFIFIGLLAIGVLGYYSWTRVCFIRLVATIETEGACINQVAFWREITANPWMTDKQAKILLRDRVAALNPPAPVPPAPAPAPVQQAQAPAPVPTVPAAVPTTANQVKLIIATVNPRYQTTPLFSHQPVGGGWRSVILGPGQIFDPSFFGLNVLERHALPNNISLFVVAWDHCFEVGAVTDEAKDYRGRLVSTIDLGLGDMAFVSVHNLSGEQLSDWGECMKVL